VIREASGGRTLQILAAGEVPALGTYLLKGNGIVQAPPEPQTSSEIVSAPPQPEQAPSHDSAATLLTNEPFTI
jgi:hypothetical protein